MAIPNGPRLRGLLRLALAWALLIPGALLFLLPIPVGLPILLAGASLLLIESAGARRLLGRLRVRNPRFGRFFARCLPLLPRRVQQAVSEPVRDRRRPPS